MKRFPVGTALAAAALAAAVLVPCGSWWWVGSRAVEREAAARERDAWRRVQVRADAVAARAARRLEELRSTESGRNWRHWRHAWVEDDAACGCEVLRVSPLVAATGDGAVRAWFEIVPEAGLRVVRGDERDVSALAALGRPLAATLAVPPRVDEVVEPESDPLDRLAPDRAAASETLLAQGPFEWRTVSIEGEPRLAAVREVRTDAGGVAQAFLVDPGFLAGVDSVGAGDRLVHGPAQSAGEAELPLAATVWRAVVDPGPDLESARAASQDARRAFRRSFAGGAAAALVAAGFGFAWLRQRERTAALRERWAAAAAHELRGPLAGLRLHGELLAGKLDDPAEARRRLDVIVREVGQLERLVDNVVAYGRLRRNAPPAPVDSDDLADAVRAVVEAAAPALADLGAHVELAVERDLPPARLDRERLRQALWNLLDNAARHGRGPSGRVRVRVRRAGDALAVDVDDDGPGLPAEVVRTTLRGGRESTPRPDGGLGIGLALARTATRAMGGDLVLRPGSERGTCLSIVLPSDPDLIIDAPD